MKLHKLKPTEIFCCGDKGCGKCEVIEDWYTYSEEIFQDNIRVLHQQKVFLSDCCHGSLFVWDTEKDDEVEWRDEQ